MLHMDWKRLRKLHKIARNRETVLVNTFTEITTIIVKCYKCLCRQFAIMEMHVMFFFFLRYSDRIVLLLKMAVKRLQAP